LIDPHLFAGGRVLVSRNKRQEDVKVGQV